ncbi:MAG TPA: endolytic transglycosylase MltG [Gemmatimonadaceae bacterium]|nr:endolytic transglycosylase MltG [Gemmatimonadaceae bacterium]
MRRVRTIAALAAASMLAGCGADAERCGLGRGNTSRAVTIPAGASLGSAADSLHRVGLIRSTQLFRLYAKVTGRERAIKAGRYRFACDDATWNGMLDRLALGPDERRLTVPEGYRLTEIVPLIAKAVGVPEDSVWAAVRDTALRRELDVPTPDLEGYLFPDTYHLTHGTPAIDVVRLMVRRFEQVWQDEWNARLQVLAMNRHDIVTLASIVEKEARLDEERPVIAAVYHNRLRDGMPLQADPTVQYARGQHTNRVLYRDLEVESPYNTYRNAGLPPGPIAAPGRASLEAALHPADVPYKFFVAHPDGHHEFRVTFREHTEARAAIRREQQRRERQQKGG